MTFERNNQVLVPLKRVIFNFTQMSTFQAPKRPLSSQTSFAGEQTSKFVTDGSKVLISSHFFQMIPYWYGPGIHTVRAVLVVIVMKQQGQLNVPAHLCKCSFVMNWVGTPGRRQSKTLLTIDERQSKTR